MMCDRHDPEDFFSLGCQAELEGDFAQAQEWYRQALRLEPDNPGHTQAMARLAKLMGDRETAASLYMKAINCAIRASGGSNAQVTSLVCEYQAL